MARLVLLLVACLMAQAFAAPARAGSRRHSTRPLRADAGADAEVNFSASADANVGQSTSSTSSYDLEDDDDDEFEDNMQPAPSGGAGGSNLVSLLNLASALFPSASGATLETTIRRIIREYFLRNPIMLRRQDIADNVIEIDYINQLTPPFQRQETEENGHDTDESEDSNGDDSNGDDSNGDDDDDSESESKETEADNAAEESIEENADGNDKSSKQDSGLKENDESDYSDEPPGGDGQGGGILGLLAGLSGGEDGQSDLGSLLAAVSGIVGSLSGDGFDLNSLIATAFGLFVGLLSEGEENPGAVIASYLLTSLDTITGGGAENNGQYFGKFLSTLLKGSSAVSDESVSGEDNANKTPMADSGKFFASFLMGLSGDMSKTSSGGSSGGAAWRRR